jgi:hypothetical protein
MKQVIEMALQAELLPLHAYALQPATLESAMSDAFPEANKALKRTPGLDADLSGSTGIVAVSAQGWL